jgi:hypothetical protein
VPVPAFIGVAEPVPAGRGARTLAMHILIVIGGGLFAKAPHRWLTS